MDYKGSTGDRQGIDRECSMERSSIDHLTCSRANRIELVLWIMEHVLKSVEYVLWTLEYFLSPKRPIQHALWRANKFDQGWDLVNKPVNSIAHLTCSIVT